MTFATRRFDTIVARFASLSVPFTEAGLREQEDRVGRVRCGEPVHCEKERVWHERRTADGGVSLEGVYPLDVEVERVFCGLGNNPLAESAARFVKRAGVWKFESFIGGA